jgi:antitoxin component YwqK of YwqJK toxin-antitoxin module
MKIQSGTVILLAMIFIAVVTGYLVVNTAYKKKNPDQYKQLETLHTREYGDISLERYYRNGMNVKAFGYYKDGTLKSEYYVTDQSGNASKYISYYPNRQVETNSITWLENGKKQFVYEEYFPDGTVRRREGSQIPKWEYYDENGDPTVFYLKDGERTTEIMYFPGSRKQEESDYLNGIRDGRWQQWDSTGRQTRDEVYKDGVKVR